VEKRSPEPRTTPADPGVARYTVLSHLLDQAFRVPGTSWRFGLDAIIGLIPGAGDIAGAVVGLYGVWVARQLGAPTSLLARMLGNLAIDAVVGAVPILGDLFDFGYKPHVRNVVLIERWLGAPHTVRRRSRLGLAAIALVLLLLVAGIVWLTIASLRWLAGALA
jgi:hypothetical protein